MPQQKIQTETLLDADQLVADFKRLSRQQQIGILKASPDVLAFHLTKGAYQLARHVVHMAKVLQRVALGNQRIILEVPVRHGKSLLASHWLPVWMLAIRPSDQILFATYEATYSAEWGQRVRDTLMEFGKELGCPLATANEPAFSWNTAAGGGMHTCGVLGPLTGKGGHLLIDDPIKNAAEAHSEHYRESLWTWWTQTARTRLDPNASVVISMARWHEDDLVGRLLELAKTDPMADQWTVVRLPARAEENDPLGRAPGEPLWPERYDSNKLDAARASSGPYAWSALYQQRPSPAGGGMFKRDWFRYYTDPSLDGPEAHYKLHAPGGNYVRLYKSDCWRFAVADLALTTATRGSYTVIQVWDVEKANEKEKLDQRRMVLVHQWRKRADAPEVEAQLLKTLSDWSPSLIVVEDAYYGKAIIQSFRRMGLPVKGVKADTDKIARAALAEVWMESGKVWLPRVAGWLQEFEAEILAFPTGRTDDQVDTLAHAVRFAADRDLWRAVAKPNRFPLGSYGQILGFDKIFAPKKTNSPFHMDQSRS